MSNNKDIETNINENTEKSETPKKKNIVHVFRPQNTQNGGNKGRRSGDDSGYAQYVSDPGTFL